MKPKIEIQWREQDLDEVIRYFAEGFEPKNGKVVKYEFTIDTFKRLVVFKLFIESK